MPYLGGGGRIPSTGNIGHPQSASTHIPQPCREPGASDSNTRGEDRSLKVSPERQSTVLTRKKLPWLDGPEQSKPGRIPGQFESKESLTLGDAHHSPPPVPEKDPSPAAHRLSASSLGHDPALRAVGSTPSLRKRARSGDFKTPSLTSKTRAGITPVTTREYDRRALGVVDQPHPPQAAYASSEYSTSPASEKGEILYPRLKADPSSYEKLDDRRRSTKTERDDPFHLLNPGLRSELNLPLGQPSPHRLRKVPVPAQDPQLSPRQTARSPSKTYRSDSCRSCESPPQISQLPKAKTMPRGSIAMPRLERSLPPSPPPTRKPTLYAMPEHLLLSSSSSSSPPPRLPAGQAASTRPATTLPARPRPTASRAQDTFRQSQSLNRAVTGLENLMEEALNVARDAAQRGENEEVANILNGATAAIRKASTVHSEMDRGHMSRPLRLSPPESARTSNSDETIAPDSDRSSTHSTGHSVDTAPTLVTKSAQSSQQPLVVSQYKAGGQAPVSRKASVETQGGRAISADRHSMSRTPPRLYQPPSADSIVRDFAYARQKTARAEAARQLSKSFGAASDYYGDNGQSIDAQPGVRPSISRPIITDKPLPPLPGPTKRHSAPNREELVPPHHGRRQHVSVRRLEHAPTETTIPPRVSSRSYEKLPEPGAHARRRHQRHQRPHLSDLFTSSYYDQQPGQERGMGEPEEGDIHRQDSLATDTRYALTSEKRGSAVSKSSTRYSGPSPLLQRNVSLRHPRRKHLSLNEGQGFSLGRYHRRQPIAREWSTSRKRITAMIACMNTMFIGLVAGIYAGEVPKIQYVLADTKHQVILGNVVLFACLGVTTIIFWPLPLLHGRKPYTLLAFALMLPLMLPQALAVSGYHSPYNPLYKCGLLIPRAFVGIAMGFANINFLPTLFDLFGASLMADKPHQEIVVYDDVRRQGGGIGVWLGIWSFCFVGSMSIGFCVGAVIISDLSPAWGFWIIVIMLAFFLLINVIAPETRRAPYRRSIAQYMDDNEKLKRRVARGEVKLHISNDGPKWWYEEVMAGLVLTRRIVFQAGFFIMILYLSWMYAQVTLVILLLGALLSREYMWQPHYVGLAVLSVAIGAFLAIPLSKGNLFSRARDHPQRTDSMTMRHSRMTWTSHMLRRCIFTLTLPLAAVAYALSTPGSSVSWTTPTVFCGLIGFLSNLAIAECVGLIMETFDTCDLQPGVNQKHRLQSMAETTRRRRTNYSSFPRICAGFFAAQGLGFILSAASTGVSGDITRAVGAQTATAIYAAILMVLTVLFIIVLWRWKELQVIPNNAFGSKNGSIAWGPGAEDPEWKPVVIGNPSGKMRRMNLLEIGGLSRWTEIRKLNKLVRN